MESGGSAIDSADSGDTGDTGEAPPSIQPPGPIDHILLISMDTLRADMLTPAVMPLLSARMSEGIVLRQHWNLGSWTRHTMPGLMTGKTVVDLGPEVYYQQYPAVPDDETTLAETLRDAGFATYFDNANDVDGSEINMLQGYAYVVERNTMSPGEFGGAPQQTDRMFAWVAEQSVPWFGHLHTIETHDPYQTFAPSCEDNAEALAAACPYDLIHGEAESMNAEDFSRVDHEACEAAIAAVHSCEATYLDSVLDAFIERMEAAGYLDRTLIVVTADHGEGWGEHSWNHHHDLYAPVTRGLAWFWYPGVGGLETIDVATSQADVVPTLFALAGVISPVALDGTSVTDLPDGHLVTHFACDPHTQFHGAVSADGGRHLLFTTPSTWELYDPIADPGELAPLDENLPDDLVAAIEAQEESTVGYCQ